MGRSRRRAGSRSAGRRTRRPPAGGRRRRVADDVDLLVLVVGVLGAVARSGGSLRPRIGLPLLRHEAARHRSPTRQGAPGPLGGRLTGRGSRTSPAAALGAADEEDRTECRQE